LGAVGIGGSRIEGGVGVGGAAEGALASEGQRRGRRREVGFVVVFWRTQA
jgi:hypothetical protein